MAKGFPVLVLLSCLAVTGPASAGQAPVMKDPQIASRALTIADLEKYVAILTKVTQANKERKGDMSQAAMQVMNGKKAKACEEHGWTSLDYGVVDARVMTAQMHLKMANAPVPASKKADVDITRQFQDKIAAAKK